MQYQCLARPTPPPRPFDLVPWLSGFAVLSLVGVSVLRKIAAWAAWDLPRDVTIFLGAYSWWAYWGSVVVFGLVVIRRWHNTYFRWRTLSIMVSQTIFGILLTGPLKQELGVPVFWQRLQLTWPLHMAVITPYWRDKLVATFLYGTAISLFAWPIVSMLIGLRYCSWFCFCGNLAESAGDAWRTKGPKGPAAQVLDNTGYGILGVAALVTGAAWLAMSWPWTIYDIGVTWLLSTVVGIGAYPILGGRVWCRFICPLRTMLGWFSKRGRFAIYTDDHRCIECGTCNRYCEMGIDIGMRARQGIPLRDTECVGCGACIAVCPRYALSFYPFPSPDEAVEARDHRRFRRPYKRQLATPRGV